MLPAGAHGPPAAAAASTGSRSSRTGPHADDSQRGSPRLLRTHEAKAGDDGDEKEGDGHTEVVRNPMHSNS
ncbi:hypothetical protein EON67_11805 [archaeon]|nr:MAG: hypothetical protein EON67_11805 [archaeon]